MKDSLQFTFVETQDGSPTVRLGRLEAGSESRPEPQPEELGEAMHSLRGAFSETVYIYGTAISTMLEKRFEPRVLSLGLGMGYVEILAAGLCLKATLGSSLDDSARLMDNFGGESFEFVPELRDWFVYWLQDKRDLVRPDFALAYDEILKRTSVETGVEAQKIKSFLAKLVAKDRWQIREALDAATAVNGVFGAICFDAFSSKTSPDLWTETFLHDFIAKACARDCVLSTYACTGVLKRTLKASGFNLQIREGFASKRDSTFAVREGQNSQISI